VCAVVHLENLRCVAGQDHGEEGEFLARHGCVVWDVEAHQAGTCTEEKQFAVGRLRFSGFSLLASC
jgi:hypothetical protein